MLLLLLLLPQNRKKVVNFEFGASNKCETVLNFELVASQLEYEFVVVFKLWYSKNCQTVVKLALALLVHAAFGIQIREIVVDFELEASQFVKLSPTVS